MIKYTLKATIPVTSYGNICPEIELEGEDINELHRQASEHIENIWKRYGERPLPEKSMSGMEKRKTFTGEEILYNTTTHSYTDLDGNVLLSGSKYAESVSQKFDIEAILPKTAKSWKVDEKALGAWWKVNGEITSLYGNAIHKALEAIHMYSQMGATIAELKEMVDNYCLPKIPHLKEAVKHFVDLFGLDAEVEVLISDVANKRAGQIDRLQILDKKNKICRIGDYKVNFEMDDKKLKKHQAQLSFYAKILSNFGWTVAGLDIFHFTDKWEKIELEVLEVEDIK